MNLAKMSERGRLTLPKEIREALHLKQGDKVLFIQNKANEFVIMNASVKANERSFIKHNNHL